MNDLATAAYVAFVVALRAVWIPLPLAWWEWVLTVSICGCLIIKWVYRTRDTVTGA